ncbi:MAG: hypothetical protein WBW48_19455, partial [Anaerolineae bacterium]
MKSRTIVILLATVAILTLLWAAGSAIASPPGEGPRGEGEVTIAGMVASSISYQGRLTDADGNPVPDDTYTMVFRLYGVSSGGSYIWESAPQSVNVSGGLFNHILPVPQDHFDGRELWLEIKVGDEWLSPRQQIVPVPYALSLRPGAEIKGETDEPVIEGENTGHGHGLVGRATWYN